MVGQRVDGASKDGNELRLTTEATNSFCRIENGVLLGEVLVVLGSSFSLSEVDPLEDGYELRPWMVKVLFLA